MKAIFAEVIFILNESFQPLQIHPSDRWLSFYCHSKGVKKAKRGKWDRIMNDQMFIETLIISSSFLTIAVILIASVLFLEKNG
ncbi:hypothetical protein M2429_004007 [Enterobacter sp. A4]